RSEEHTSELQSHLNLVCRIIRSEEHTSELQSHLNLVCRLLLEKKKKRSRKAKTKRRRGREYMWVTAVRNARSHRQVLLTRLPCLSRFFVFLSSFFFFLNDPAPPEFSPFPLPDALPI